MPPAAGHNPASIETEDAQGVTAPSTPWAEAGGVRAWFGYVADGADGVPAGLNGDGSGEPAEDAEIADTSGHEPSAGGGE